MIKKLLKKILRNTFWSVYGLTIKNPRLPGKPRYFLFVCKGNVCRSPFAERLAIAMAEKMGLKNKVFSSAGLQVSKTLPSPDDAVVTAENYAVSLSGHHSQGITSQMARSADMIIAMDVSIFKSLRNFFPELQEKIFLLPIFLKNKERVKEVFYRYNIPDPFGKSLEEFRDSYEQIIGCLEGLFDKINKG